MFVPRCRTAELLSTMLEGLARPECASRACCAEPSNMHRLCDCLNLGLMLPIVRESNPMLEWNPLYSFAGRPSKPYLPTSIDDAPSLKFWDGRIVALPPLASLPRTPLSCNVNLWNRLDFPI